MKPSLPRSTFLKRLPARGIDSGLRLDWNFLGRDVTLIVALKIALPTHRLKRRKLLGHRAVFIAS